MAVGHDDVYDVAVIGGGLVGCALARELTGLQVEGRPLRVVLIEARDDVGDGTSKANTAILHTGFDAAPGSVEAALVARGYHLLAAYAARTGIPVEATGAVLVAWTPQELATLPTLQAKAVANGYSEAELIDADAVYAMVPALGPGVLGGMTVPGESIICSWTTTLAYATEARLRGCEIRLGHEVTGVDVCGAGRTTEYTTVHTTGGALSARWVCNAAGLGGDVIDRLFGHDRFTVTPRRGELLVFDKLTRPAVDHIVLPVPSAMGKGVLVSPTVYGNVMLGPTSEDLTDKTMTGTSQAGFEFLRTKGARIMPWLLDQEVTAAYAGLRAATEHSDYVIDLDPDQRYLLLGGIRSTGLTASMAIAEHAVGLLQAAGLEAVPRSDLPEPPRMPTIGAAGLRPYADAERIAADPAYGHVVCFCERVSAGEIRDALAATVPARTLDGLRRRTRAMTGRCQGFFCGAEVTAAFEAAVGGAADAGADRWAGGAHE
jgi:glycerol-3-phosphate dehydrogenase